MRIAAAVLLATLASAAVAQELEKPLGELLEALPPPEGEAARPASPPAAPPPEVPQGSVGTLQLPPSQADEGLAPGASTDEAVDAVVDMPGLDVAPADEAAAAAAEAEAAWAAMQEARRAKVNALEAPLVAGLNAEAAERLEEQRRRNEEAQAAYQQSLAEREEAIRRRDSQYRAALESHRREAERQRQRYEACLAGVREACEAR